jgi:cobalt-zinc-cadmium efflux system membrane fusion protein
MSRRPTLVRSGRALLAVLSAALGPALAAGCGKHAGDEGDGAEPRPVVGARTAVVTTQPFTETVGAIGTVVGRAGHVAALGAPAAARVARVLVTAGQHVRAGQPLVELDQTTFRGNAESAAAALSASERAYERAQRLVDEGIAPRKDVEQAAAELARARADAVAARRAEQLSVLRAPIAGVVTRMAATLGATADPSQPLVEITDASALDVVLSVTPADAARVRPGAAVSLGAGQGAAGEPLGAGAVADVAGAVDSTSRSVAVRVRPTGVRRPLRIGETVSGQIAVAVVPNAVTVPLEALVPDGEAFRVFVVDASGTAHARTVSVGARTDAAAEIRSGLAPGERVVTYGAYGVEDSAKVVPVQQAAPGAAGQGSSSATAPRSATP